MLRVWTYSKTVFTPHSQFPTLTSLLTLFRVHCCFQLFPVLTRLELKWAYRWAQITDSIPPGCHLYFAILDPISLTHLI